MALKLAGEDPMKGAAVDRQDDGSKSEIMDSVDIICKLEEVPSSTSEERCDSQELMSQGQISDNKEETENSISSETDIDSKGVEGMNGPDIFKLILSC